ncbi:hypothetical protein DESUT3_05750 [Desulfuromonas versatilis]|uniref:diguanylate cyclase n=1 Tax=Desulfuromonas versatilis TaxID=2802975 RepID=A0ABM8HSC6_9BACT|nr:GGDEF domain-containing protein [Desulfuromonas versatilis]BCR03506.1 hypothetical protein DESUT3_05750 [Desulfuromonas versatilis]
MNKEQVLSEVLASGTLPTLAPVASKLVEISAREETTIADIAGLVAKDISLSAKVLKVVNSAFYSFPQKISTIHQAVSILGINAIRNLVFSFSFLGIEPSSSEDSFDYREFWTKSLAAAVSARLIVSRLKQKGIESEEIFIAGLLQNAGELFLARAFPGPYLETLARHSGQDGSLLEAEREVTGADHAFIGSEVFKTWRFPEVLWRPIRHHHSPREDSTADARAKFTTFVVHLSGVLADILYSPQPDALIKAFRARAKAVLRLSDADIDAIFESVHLEVNEAADYFGLKIAKTRSVAEILQQANAELSVLNLSYEQMNRELVQHKVRLETLTRELEEKNRILERLVHIDGLTEVYNHRFFQDFLGKELTRAMRHERPVSLVLVDIDHFKAFNDSYGHQVGDFILKEVCAVARQSLREHDIMARYGGEEFVFVLPETSAEGALKVAERVRQAVEEHRFTGDGGNYRVTMSLGVATMLPPGDSFKKNEFIGYADEALLQAKRRGRNRVEVFAPKTRWFGRK